MHPLDQIVEKRVGSSPAYDGDTVFGLTDNPKGARLAGGIDAPEVRPPEPGGQVATDALNHLIQRAGDNLRIKVDGQDTHGRDLVRLYDGDREINEELVGLNAARPTDRSVRYYEGDYTNALNRAVARRLGLRDDLDTPEEWAITERFNQISESVAGTADIPYGSPIRTKRGLLPSVERGVDTLQGTFYGAAAAFGDLIGSDDLRDFGIGGYQRNQTEAALNPKSLQFKDIEGAGDFFDWFIESVAEASPSIALSLTGGGVGAVTAKTALKKGIQNRMTKQFVKNGFDKKYAEHMTAQLFDPKRLYPKLNKAMLRGAQAGAFASSYIPQVGEAYTSMLEDGTRSPGTALFVTGPLGAALDAAPFAAVLERAFKGIPAANAKQLVMSMASMAGITSLLEGSTEAAQEFIIDVAKAYHNPEYDLFSVENREKWLESFAVGSAAGLVFGGPAAAAGAAANPIRQEDFDNLARGTKFEHPLQGLDPDAGLHTEGEQPSREINLAKNLPVQEETAPAEPETPADVPVQEETVSGKDTIIPETAPGERPAQFTEAELEEIRQLEAAIETQQTETDTRGLTEETEPVEREQVQWHSRGGQIVDTFEHATPYPTRPDAEKRLAELESQNEQRPEDQRTEFRILEALDIGGFVIEEKIPQNDALRDIISRKDIDEHINKALKLGNNKQNVTGRGWFTMRDPDGKERRLNAHEIAKLGALSTKRDATGPFNDGVFAIERQLLEGVAMMMERGWRPRNADYGAGQGEAQTLQQIFGGAKIYKGYTAMQLQQAKREATKLIESYDRQDKILEDGDLREVADPAVVSRAYERRRNIADRLRKDYGVTVRDEKRDPRDEVEEAYGEAEGEQFTRKSETKDRKTTRYKGEEGRAPLKEQTQRSGLHVMHGDKKLASAAKSMFKLLGMDDLAITLVDEDGLRKLRDAGRIPATHADERLRDGSTQLGTLFKVPTRDGNTAFVIYVKNAQSLERRALALTHELGHVFQFTRVNKMSLDLRKRLVKMFEESTGESVEGIEAELLFRTPDFKEWFANQVADWALTDRKPRNILETHFRTLGRKLKALLKWFHEKFGVATPDFREFMNAVAKVEALRAEGKALGRGTGEISGQPQSTELEQQVEDELNAIHRSPYLDFILSTEQAEIKYSKDKPTKGKVDDGGGVQVEEIEEIEITAPSDGEARAATADKMGLTGKYKRLFVQNGYHKIAVFKGPAANYFLRFSSAGGGSSHLEVELLWLGKPKWYVSRGHITIDPKDYAATAKALRKGLREYMATKYLPDEQQVYKRYPRADRVDDEWFSEQVRDSNNSLDYLDEAPDNLEIRPEIERLRDRLRPLPIVQRTASVMDTIRRVGSPVFATTDGWTRRYLPEFKIDGVHFMDYMRHKHGTKLKARALFDLIEFHRGRFNAKMHAIAATVKGKSDKELKAYNNELGMQLLRGVPTEQLDETGQMIRGYFRSIYEYLNRNGLEFPFREDYFPHVFDQTQLVERKEVFLRMLQNRAFSYDDALKVWHTAMRQPMDMQVGQQHEITGARNPSFAFANHRLLSDRPEIIEELREAGFYSTDALGMLGTYTHAAMKKLAWSTHFGERTPDGKWDDLGKLREALALERTRPGRDDAALDHFENSVLPALQGTLGASMDPRMRHFQGWVQTYQNLRLLSFVTFTSLVDPANIALRGKGYGPLLKALRSLKNNRADLMRVARMLGVWEDRILDHALHSLEESQFQSGSAKKVNEWFFKWNGIQWWTNASRLLAMTAGEHFIQEQSMLAARGDTNAVAALEELGLQAGDFNAWEAAGRPVTDDDNAAAVRMQQALIQFTNESIVRPNAAIRTHWMSDPRFMLITHLKPFLWGFGKVVLEQLWAQTKQAQGMQKALPAVTLGAALLPLAALGYELRKLVGSLGDDRERPWEKDPEDGWEYVWEVLQRSGALGATQIFVDMDQAEDRNRLAILSALGPSMTHFEEAVDKIDISFDGVEGVDKFAIRSLPILSSFPAARDFLRGE